MDLWTSSLNQKEINNSRKIGFVKEITGLIGTQTERRRLRKQEGKEQMQWLLLNDVTS